jgi:hypothetical protein
MKKSWATDIRDKCIALGVPYFFKQWGGWNKKAAGRELDGRIWNQMPPLAHERIPDFQKKNIVQRRNEGEGGLNRHHAP